MSSNPYANNNNPTNWKDAYYLARLANERLGVLELQVAAQAAYSLIYADEAARLAATGFTADDVGRIAWQQSDNTFWQLTDYSPITWAEVSGATAIPVHAPLHLPGGIDALTCGVPVDVGTANAEGGAAAFARSDHGHSLPAVGTAGTSALATVTVDAYGRVTAHAPGAVVGFVPTSRLITTGNGIGGGGDLSADRTISISPGAGIVVGADSVGLDSSGVTPATYTYATVTVDTYGRVTLASSGAPPVLLHNSAPDLQGGQSIGTFAEYYHLTSAQHSGITGIAAGGVVYAGSTGVAATDAANLSYAAGVLTAGGVAYPTIQTDTTEPTGFVDRVATLSWTDPAGTFLGRVTITGAHSVYINGVKYAKSTESLTIPDVTGLYYFYYNASSVMTASTVWPGFALPLIATVYYNATTNLGLLGEERHGIAMDHDTHEYLHDTVGTRYKSGLGATFADATFSIDAGVIHDEDLDQSIGAQTTCNVLYKDGSADWKWDAAATTYYNGAAGSLKYNNGNTLAAAGANQYLASWIFATNDPTRPIVAIIGQRVDTTLANARANNKYESLALGTLPFKEMKLLYRVILRNDAAPFEETQDLRSVSNVPAGTYVAMLRVGEKNVFYAPV